MRCSTIRGLLLLLILWPATTSPAAAIPVSADTSMAVARFTADLAAGSFTIANNVWPRIEFSTHEMLSMSPPATDVTPEPPFPSGAKDLQNWIGGGWLESD